MTRHELEALFARVLGWPEDRQAHVADYLLRLEGSQGEASELTEEQWKLVEEGLAEADRGEFATDEEVKAVFDKYRLK